MTFQFKTQKRLSKYLTRNLIRLLPEPKHCHSFSCHLTALKTPSTKCNHSDTLLHTNSLHSLLFSSPYDRPIFLHSYFWAAHSLSSIALIITLEWVNINLNTNGIAKICHWLCIYCLSPQNPYELWETEPLLILQFLQGYTPLWMYSAIFHSWCWRLNLVSALHMLNKWSSPELAPPVKKNTSFENYSKFHRLVLSFLCSLRKPWIHCFLPTIFTKLGWQSCTNQAQLCLFIHKGMDRTVKNFLLAYLNLRNVPEKHDYFLFLSLYSILCAETTTGL